jgi:hypothetical protein
MKNRFLLITLAVLTMGLFITPNVRAEDDPEAQPPAPPQVQAQPQASPQAQPQSVARISVVHGNVSTMRGDAGEWVAGTVNTPVVPGDKVATADRSRAELQLDYANIIRLDERTEAAVAELTQNRILIQLSSGLVEFSAVNGTQADAEIDTPNMGVHLLAPGVYRIQVNSPTETLLIVRKGDAEVLTNQGSTKVEAGQIINIHGADNPEYKIDPAPAGGDDFDKWCMDRDRQIASAQAWKHTDPYYTGSSDLDASGTWEEVPDYGWCWTPMVDAGWVPYSVGRWGWEPYWGWTWISYEPWGWAPYHYGRWFMYGGRWAWWPARGFYGPRPIWAPAYVSFFGFGGGGFGIGVGFGFGSIGWLALGPRDVFHPWFGAGHRFAVTNFNNLHGVGFVTPGGRPYGSNLERAMTDERMRSAIRNVSAQDFASGRVSHSSPVSESMLRNASMVRGTVPVAPTRASLGNRVASPSGMHSESANGEHFFSSRGATTTGRATSFSSEANQVRNMVDRGPSNESGRAAGNMESSGPRSNSMATGHTGTGESGAGGSPNSVGRNTTSGRAPASAPSSGFHAGSAPTTHGNNWQRFASPSPYGRTGSGSSTSGGSWKGYSNPARTSSGSSGSRPSLNLNRNIMGQRPSSGGTHNSSAPSGGSHGKSAPSGGHASAPHSSGSGGGHSSGGGHGHGR